ncbi:MAG: large subunit ribosomal protein L10 [Sphingobacteriales bacterium]|jgi:large subunit ribosomal protein L10
MTKEEKIQEVQSLNEQLKGSACFYLTDTSALSVEQVSKIRRECFDQGVQLRVAKNTLLKRALMDMDGDFAEMWDSLKGPTSIMFSNTGNLPARVIKELRKKFPKPILKAAYIEESIYLGDESLEMLVNLKSKEELIAEIIALLQSPAKNVVSALQSGGNKLSGLVKALGEREA